MASPEGDDSAAAPAPASVDDSTSTTKEGDETTTTATEASEAEETTTTTTSTTEEEEEAPPPPKLTTVDDYTSPEELADALAGQEILEEWKLPTFDPKTSQGDPNDVEREARRLLVLKSYDVLDSEKEDEFEEITKEATAYFNVPVAVVSLVDMGRQWFKSIQGFPASETPRCISFCQHVVKRKERLGPMIIEDAKLDDRFKDNPLVANEPFVTFYAGAPLISPEGHILGTFCILDFQARTMTKAETRRLEAFAQEAMFHIISRQPPSSVIKV